MTVELKNYRTEQGIKTVLVDNDKGRKYLYVLIMDGTLKLKKVPKSEERFMQDAIESKQRRNLNGAFRMFASYGRQQGATKEAKQALREMRS